MDGREPWMLNAMDELLVLARAMEQEAIAGYQALAERMRQANRPDLTAVFEALILEEQGHLGNVDSWIEKSATVVAARLPPSTAMFDDEGAALVAPEMLDAYRAFAVAVRNEERAFVFWTYVSAHAVSDEIRQAAERMAREELGHVSTLRRERRRAFHDPRGKRAMRPITVADLETRWAGHLFDLADQAVGEEGDDLRLLAERARSRVAYARKANMVSDGRRGPDGLADGVEARLPAVAEWLLDYYLDLAERADVEPLRMYAQDSAAELVTSLYRLKTIPTDGMDGAS